MGGEAHIWGWNLNFLDITLHNFFSKFLWNIFSFPFFQPIKMRRNYPFLLSLFGRHTFIFHVFFYCDVATADLDSWPTVLLSLKELDVTVIWLKLWNLFMPCIILRRRLGVLSRTWRHSFKIWQSPLPVVMTLSSGRCQHAVFSFFEYFYYQ